MKYIAVWVLAALLTVACGKKDAEKETGRPAGGVASKAIEKNIEKAIEKNMEKETGGKAQVDLQTGLLNIKQDDGSLSISADGKAEMPEGFPKDVPVFEGARVVMSSREQDRFTVSLETDQPAAKVADAYHLLMVGQGWERNVHHSVNNIQVMGYDKDDRHVNLNVFGGKPGEKTQIAIIVGPKTP